MESKLFESCEGLINAIANKFYNVDKQDLIQAGKLGLINAYRHFDKNSDTKFSTYAYSYIYGEMYNLSINSKSIKNSKDNIKLYKLIEKSKILLTQKLNKEPSIHEIASYLNMDVNTINNILLSMESIASIDNNNYFDNTFKYEEDNDLKIDLINYINELDSPYKEIIIYRYYNDLTQSEIAKLLNMSQVKVSRYENKTLKLLKKEMIYE